MKTKTSKRDAILEAMLDLVVERGFHEAPMSLVSERSGASPGLIYHHFASKDAIIQALYERVRRIKTESVLKGYRPEMEAREAFVQGLCNMYEFYRRHQREMRFLEQYESAGFVCTPDEDNEAVQAFIRRFSPRSEGGVLQEWPRDVLEAMTLGTVGRLARLPKKIPAGVMREIAEKAWEMVKG